MYRSLLKSLLVGTFAAAAYHVAADLALPWGPVFAPAAGGFVSLQIGNTAVLIALSIPFALALAWPGLALASPVAVAMLVTTVGLLMPSLPHASQALVPGAPGASVAIDLAKFVLVLPLLTWMAGRWLTSDNPSRRTPLRGAA